MSDFNAGKFVVGRKQYRCEPCWAIIPKGERHFHFRGVFDGEWQNWRAHIECEAALMADGECEFIGGEFPVPERIARLHSEVKR